MPQLPLALRDRIRNQAPAVRWVHLARCVNAPVASLQGRTGGWPQRVTRPAIPHLRIEQPLATHPKYGCPGPRLADRRPSPSARSRPRQRSSHQPTQIAADDRSKQRGGATGARVGIVRETPDQCRRSSTNSPVATTAPPGRPANLGTPRQSWCSAAKGRSAVRRVAGSRE